MPLSDAILEIAKDMDGDITPMDLTPHQALVVIGWIRQLRSAVKAAEGQQVIQQSPIIFNPFEKKAEEAAAKRALREVEDRINIQERQGSTMVNCIGGQSDDTMMEISAGMPIDGTAKMLVVGQVYVREADGNLHYSEEETNKFRSK